MKATLKVNAVLPSWSCGTFSKLAVSVSVLRIVPVAAGPKAKRKFGSYVWRETVNVSLGSFSESSRMPYETVCSVSLGWKTTA